MKGALVAKALSRLITVVIQVGRISVYTQFECHSLKFELVFRDKKIETDHYCDWTVLYARQFI